MSLYTQKYEASPLHTDLVLTSQPNFLHPTSKIVLLKWASPGTLWGCTLGNTCVSNPEEPIKLRKVATMSILGSLITRVRGEELYFLSCFFFAISCSTSSKIQKFQIFLDDLFCAHGWLFIVNETPYVFLFHVHRFTYPGVERRKRGISDSWDRQ